VAFQEGADDARALGYVPLPPELASRIESYWSTVPVAARAATGMAGRHVERD
jgi:phosphate transport system substrate-binding protein